MPSASDARAGDTRGRHGGRAVPGLRIDSYNLALREGDGFVGDRASQRAFRHLLDARRRDQRTGPEDPFGDTPSTELSKAAIDEILLGGDPDAAHLVHGAIEDYAGCLADVVRRFLGTPEWRGVERIVLGGGLQESRVGGLAVRRAEVLLRHAGVAVPLCPLGNDADHGGLLGWVQLAPAPVLAGYETFLAVDIGGTKIRCGLVAPCREEAADGSAATVLRHMAWRHRSDRPSREQAVRELAAMLNGLSAQARTVGIRVAPFVGIACPGEILPDGRIARGAQNLPGDWEAEDFSLPRALDGLIDAIDGGAPQVVMHNDAVVQGLSERPRMQDTRRWGVLTVGTGLGNASYTNGDD
ncbi:ROK family protein [Coralloluteibacterium thermophilus]|uniref:ROK family protein n=1 Tax=Coralloluteibacterium thermophilum TaxID=2707049 RepID=A0ABV9NIW4_9GAMM